VACAVLGAGAILLERDRSVALGLIALVAAGPLLAHLLEGRVPRWSVGAALSLVALALLPRYESFGTFATVNLVLYAQQRDLELLVGATGLLVMAGFSPVSSVYAVASGAFTVSVALWLGLTHRAILARLDVVRPFGSRDGVRAGAQVALAVAIGSLTAQGLPAVEAWAVERDLDLAGQRTSGFGLVTDLKSVSSIKTSSRVALRVYGRSPRLLRGQVYTTYRRGVWTARRGAPAQPPRAVAASATTPERVRCELEANTILFMPLEAELDTAGPPPAAPVATRTDRFGVASLHRGPVADYAYRVPVRTEGVRSRPARSAAAPEPDDLELPVEASSRMTALAAAWTAGARSDRERAGAVLANLGRTCRYSLEPGAPGPEEPVERFLMKTRAGHCEYFASAMVLLLRCAGIPSRYVTGYSVADVNPFGGYFIARDADAHAWVEAWLGAEGWTSWDPTPPDWRDPGRLQIGEWVRQAVDYAAERWQAIRAAAAAGLGAIAGRLRAAAAGRAGARTGVLACAAAAVLAVALMLVLAPRLGRVRGWIAAALARATVPTGPPVAPDRARAVDCLRAVGGQLERLGLPRRPSETPLELVARFDRLDVPDELRRACREAVELACRTLYRGDPWDDARAAPAMARLASASARGRRVRRRVGS
jgi:transglutaminase-like putative cysteine protease